MEEIAGMEEMDKALRLLQELSQHIIINGCIMNQVKVLNQYSSNEKILLVGEGDFSFALSLAKFFGTARFIVATTINSEEELHQLYSNAIDNIKAFKGFGGTIFTSIDVKFMHKIGELNGRVYDKIVFNFPEIFDIGKKNRESFSSNKNYKKMIKKFFKSAQHLLDDGGEVHLTFQDNPRHKNWSSHYAQVCSFEELPKVNFCKEDYHGYTHRKGAGAIDESFEWKSSKTWRFKKKKPNMRGAREGV